MSESPQILHARCLQLTEMLLDGWRTLHGERTDGVPSQPMRAYMLLNRWSDSPLASSVESVFPALADDRRAVVAERFEDREERAPCLVSLPEVLAPCSPADTLAAQAARDWLAQWLANAWQQTLQRLARQDFCAVVFSRLPVDSVVQHAVGLGHQQSPITQEFRTIRYQDPRVMQRVWPLLAHEQQRRWLGPITQWWALAQPWGPWEPALAASSDTAVPADDLQWFQACAPALPDGHAHAAWPSTTGALFDRAQWQAMHDVPDAHRVWAGYAAGHVAGHAQPDGAAMHRLLADGQRLGLAGGNLHDYVWCTWQHNAAPGAPRELDWSSPQAALLLKHILRELHKEPEARFASLYAEASQARRT